MRSKGVKIILTTSLVLAVMFAVKLNNGGSSNDLDTNVSAEVSTASGVTAGVTEVIQQNMTQYQSAQDSYEVSTMKPTTTKEPEITKEPVIETTNDSLIQSKDWMLMIRIYWLRLLWLKQREKMSKARLL